MVDVGVEARTIEAVSIVDEVQVVAAPMRLVKTGRGPGVTPTTTTTKINRCPVTTRRTSNMVKNPNTTLGVTVERLEIT